MVRIDFKNKLNMQSLIELSDLTNELAQEVKKLEQEVKQLKQQLNQAKK